MTNKTLSTFKAFLLSSLLLPTYLISEPIPSSILEQYQSSENRDIETLTPLSSSLIDNCEESESEIEIFGHEFFCSSPTSISPIGDLPVPSNYILSLRDELEIIYIGDSKNRSFIRPVRLDGTIILPEIGLINVEGQTINAVRENINSKLSNSYVGITAAISIKNLSAKKIVIVGAVKTPGSYLVNPFTTISNALSYAGGLESYASLRDVELIKPRGSRTSFDLYDLLINGDRSNDKTISSGDTILVKPTTNIVEISGSVLRPMKYEHKDDEGAKELINYALGYNKRANKELALIEKIDKNTSLLNSKYLNLSKITSLKDINKITIFDSVSNIDQINSIGGLLRAQEYSDLIRIEILGEVNNPGVYSVKPGTNINDLFSLAGGLKNEAQKDVSILTRERIKTEQLKNLSIAQDNLKKTIASYAISQDKEPSPQLMALSEIEINEDGLGRMSGDFYLGSTDSKNTLVENGDVLFVPKKFSSVTILGEVMNPSTIVHKRSTSLNDFLQLSGGLKRNAAKGRIYVIAANGKVRNVGREGWLQKDSKIQPGDTIIVPPKVGSADRIGLLTNITSIISNIAFAAASLESLRD
tara:strand:+ start:705 stop:2465 length:1761 start_codon:yes stop_codon:yes gene_type:complete